MIDLADLTRRLRIKHGDEKPSVLTLYQAADQLDALAQEVERLTKFLEQERSLATKWQEERVGLAQENAALRQRVGELEEVLQPFADACTFSTHDDAYTIDDTLAANRITWGNLRSALAIIRARAAQGREEAGG